MYFHDYMNNYANEQDCMSLNSKLKLSNSGQPMDKYRVKIGKCINSKWTDGKYYKNVEIDAHGSGFIGSPIKNAVSGSRTGALVGSKEEGMYFKVMDCSGHNGRQEPLNFYYDTPEQYENHFFIHLKQCEKDDWYKRYLPYSK